MSLTTAICTRCGENGLYCRCEQFHPNVAVSTSNKVAVWGRILTELERANRLHPSYPADPVRRVALIVEEVGEAMKEALEMARPGVDTKVISARLEDELIQVAALCVYQLLVMWEEA
jgi:hypothetical protein